MPNSILHMDTDKFDIYYHVFKNDIEHNRDRHLNFIHSDSSFYEDYVKLCNEVHKIRNNNKTSSMCGGMSTGAVVGATIGTIALTGLIAFLFWLYYGGSEFGMKCHSRYPMYRDSHPNPDDFPVSDNILTKLLPSTWIEKGMKEGKEVNAIIIESRRRLEGIQSTLDIFNKNVGTQTEQTVKTVTTIVLSIGAATLSSGAGGDNIVSIPPLVAKAVELTVKTLDKLEKITGKISETINNVSKTIEMIDDTARRVTDTFEKIEESMGSSSNTVSTILQKNEEYLSDKYKSGKNQMMFIYDLFNVDFSGGPFHNRCHVEFVMNHYMTSPDKKKYMHSIITTMNDIYIDINRTVVEFVATAIDALVPNTLGLAGTFSSLLENYSNVMYKKARKTLTDNYMRIPAEFRKLIQEPRLLKEYVSKILNKYTLGIFSQVSVDIKSSIDAYSDLFANAINKGMSMIFMFLNVFIVFSENQSTLLADYTECSKFTLDGLDVDKGNKLSESDKKNCMKCKMFFVDNIENVDQKMDEETIYSRCLMFKNEKSANKRAYENLKKIAANSVKKSKPSLVPVPTLALDSAPGSASGA